MGCTWPHYQLLTTGNLGLMGCNLAEKKKKMASQLKCSISLGVHSLIVCQNSLSYIEQIRDNQEKSQCDIIRIQGTDYFCTGRKSLFESSEPVPPEGQSHQQRFREGPIHRSLMPTPNPGACHVHPPDSTPPAPGLLCATHRPLASCGSS